MAKIIDRTKGITDPMRIQQIVVEECSAYEGMSTEKNVQWVIESLGRGSARAAILMKAGGVPIIGLLGPRPVPKSMRDAITINVKNQISSLTADVQKKVVTALIEGTSAGEHPLRIAKDIVDATGMERTRASLIAITEMHRAHSQAADAEYRKYGIEEVRYFCADDERVCDECMKHHDKVYAIDKAPVLPLHPRCRCILLPEIGVAE